MMQTPFTEAGYLRLVQDIFSRFLSVQRDGFTAGAYKPGLERMQAFEAELGHPSRSFRSIHIAGTNGKGSVANMLASACKSCGIRVGLFTSPHILDFRERMRLNGEMIPKEYVYDFLTTWMSWITAHELSFFEITTAMAFRWFADQGAEVAIIETGLGGRLDSTNILERPSLTVITSIGLDHCDMLGSTLAQIAAEKAGIFKLSVPALVGESHPQTSAVFEEKSWMHCPLSYADQMRPSLWYKHAAILKQMDLQARAQRILQAPDLNAQAVQDSIERVMAAYKEDVCRNYIYREPMHSYSYFALFQGIVVGNSYLMVFNPRRYADDVKAFAAVATCWDQFHPGSTRGENLHNIAIEGQKTQRIVQAQDTEWELDPEKVTVANLIDIDLPDNKGQVRRLTDLQGKVVLLDFHVFAAEGSAARILALRELYNKYHDRGLEIYQVSLDDDAHFWKTQTAALPWICVRDDQGASQSYLLQVQRLPADYIISRDNSVVMGPAQIKDLDADIARYL